MLIITTKQIDLKTDIPHHALQNLRDDIMCSHLIYSSAHGCAHIQFDIAYSTNMAC